MENNEDNQKITVEAPDVEGIADALGVDFADDPADENAASAPDELRAVFETLVDIYEGVEAATAEDSRGRSRKMVRQYAGREDLTSDEIGHLLRSLEAHGLVVQDGNRWRIPESET